MKLLLLLVISSFAFCNDFKFSNESALSIVQVSGNAELSTYNLKTDTTGTKNKSSIGFGGHYTLGTAEVEQDDGSFEDEESARNWDVYLKYDYQFTKTMGLYSAVQYEGNEFSGFDQRSNYDLGLKYVFTKNDKLNHFFELGYRYTYEMLTNGPDGDFQKARLYYHIKKQQTENVSYKFWTEYLPNFTESKDYIISFEPSVIVAIDKTFSLQVSYKGVYDNLPNEEGNERLDSIQTTSLIAKF